MKKELYHEHTYTCFPPLEQGPCLLDEWLVLDKVSGKGICRPKMECTDGAKPVLDQVVGAVCGCRNGKERFLGKCEALYTQSVCSDGWVLMPENFLLNSLVCSSKFRSKKYENCSSYQVAKKQLAVRGTNKRKHQKEYLKEMICSKKNRTICCPQNDNQSLFSKDNLIQSMVPSKLVCARNPCPHGKWPWVDSNGMPKCVYHCDGIESCNDELIEENGIIVCPMFQPKTRRMRSVARIFKQTCGRRRRWKYGRCTRMFQREQS